MNGSTVSQRGRRTLAATCGRVSLAGLLLAATVVVPAEAYSFVQNGVLMGTVCRNGSQFTVYPISQAQPVGRSCQVTDANGNFLIWGVITGE
jgi:hypothetical protein